jgi:hypothetical protein
VEGIDIAAGLVVATLEANLPAKITELENRYALVAGDIGEPGLVTDYPQPPETLSLNDYPAVMVDAVRLVNLLPLDLVNGNLSYLGRYRFRVFVYVRDQEFAATAAKQRRYALAVTEVLLGHQGLMTTGARVDDSTFTGDFSDIDHSDERAIAAAFLEFEMTLEEMLTTPALATAQTIDTPLSMLRLSVQEGG